MRVHGDPLRYIIAFDSIVPLIGHGRYRLGSFPSIVFERSGQISRSHCCIFLRLRPLINDFKYKSFCLLSQRLSAGEGTTNFTKALFKLGVTTMSTIQQKPRASFYPEGLHVENESTSEPTHQVDPSQNHLFGNQVGNEDNTGAPDDQQLSRHCGKTKDEDKDHYVDQVLAATSLSSSNSVASARVSCPGSPTGFSSTDYPSASSHLPRYSYKPPLSPGCTTQLSSRIHSPASSLIFERDVQEDILPAQVSPSIPSHIRTENHIPPVLEASSVAIADDQLDPDSVEIITHSVHQSAAAGVASTASAEQPLSSTWLEEVGSCPDNSQEHFATHGALDTTSVRRLSFVSFADVVNAEHVETNELLPNRDALPGTMFSGNFPLLSQNRSPSPLRSPTSSYGFSTSPPTSISTSFKGLEVSLNRGGREPGSPHSTTQSPLSPNFGSNFGSELNIETMRQALRRTGSGDLSGVRSQVSSNMGNDDFLEYST